MTNPRYQKLIFCLVIIAVVFISFRPCLNNGFVNWDDPELLTENPSVQCISVPNIARLFTRFHCWNYIPLTLLSFAMEYHLFKDNPLPFHATNIILHIINGLLVLWLVSMISKNSRIALITALIFALHPMRVESVAWITERKDVLFALFYLAAIITYMYYANRSRLIFYFVSLACFVLALFAKSVAATLPFVLLLFDYVQNRRGHSIIMNKLPYLVLAVPFAVVALAAQRTLPGHSFPIVKNIFVMSYVLLFYGAKIVLPIGLSPLYPFPTTIASALPLPFWLAPIALAIAVAAVVNTRHWTNIITFGCLFFLITILPVLQFIPVAGPELAANRYTYIPSIGLILIFATAVTWMYQKMKSFAKPLTFLPMILAAFTIILLAAMTMKRCGIWRNSITLWSTVIEKFPDFPHAYTMRAQAYADEKNLEMAIADYTSALTVSPGFSAALLGRANVHAEMNEIREALSDYEQAITYNPGNPLVYYNRGNLLLKIGDFAGAVADYTMALESDRRFADAFVNRGNAYSALGQLDLALNDYDHALVIEPAYGNAVYNRAVVYFIKGDYVRAWRDIKKLLEVGYPVKPEFLEALRKTMP